VTDEEASDNLARIHALQADSAVMARIRAESPGNNHHARPDQTEQGITYKRISSAELDRAVYAQDYHIVNVLAKKQNGSVLGPMKVMKTTAGVVDLGMSVATARPFLNYFEVQACARVGIFSLESGAANIQESARRIAKSKGLELGDISSLCWCFDRPKLQDPRHLVAIQKFIDDDELEILFIDPTYFTMRLSAQDAGNLFVVGHLLDGLNQISDKTGASIILAHHTKKTREDKHAAVELDDVAWAGFGEWMRQWICLNRYEPYDPDNPGVHKLILSCGGSAGHSGRWTVEIEEGRRSDPGGRHWKPTVWAAGKVKEEKAIAKDDERREKSMAKDKSDDLLVLKTLDALDPNHEGVKARKVGAVARLSWDRLERSITRLMADSSIEELELRITGGKGARVPARGIRRRSPVSLASRVNATGDTGDPRSLAGFPLIGESVQEM
jgi:replicative DNA helicase